MNLPNNLNKNFIADNFKLPDTDLMVILNGIYQPTISKINSNLTYKNKTLTIAKNSKNKIPLHLLFLTTEDHHNIFDIVAEENSYLHIIEEQASFENGAYTSKIETNIVMQNGSEILYQKFQLENSSQSQQQVKTIIHQEKNSNFKTTLICKDPKSSKEHSHIKLLGENASYDHKSISLLKDNQTATNQICIEHLKPNCTSNVLAKSIVDDSAINNFECRVVAHLDAIKTEAHVTNKNLLLSKKATANSAPELEIYVDDVICTHGSTMGQLDMDALFYLRSRGISKDNATKILTDGFVQEITDEILKYDRFKIASGLQHG